MTLLLLASCSDGENSFDGHDGEHVVYMEMHFVHQASDGALAVVGVFVEEDAENPRIAPLWVQLDASAGAQTDVSMSKEFAEQIFIDDVTSILHYSDSLTTPACS